MKKYIVEFNLLDGTSEEIEFVTDKIDWSIEQWGRNRAVRSYQIIQEGSSNTKRMLLDSLFIKYETARKVYKNRIKGASKD